MRFNPFYSTNRYRAFSQPVFVFLCAALVAFGVYDFLRTKELSRLEERFETLSNERFHLVQDMLETVSSQMQTLRDFFNASDFVSRDEFTTISREFLKHNQYIQLLSWVPVVRSGQRKHFEYNARRDGMEGFQFKSVGRDSSIIRSPKQEKYLPVYYIEPYTGNELFVGLDFSSDSTLHRGIDKAGRSNRLIASTPSSRVLSEYSTDAMFLFIPVYRTGAATFHEITRKENLLGYISGVFKFEELLKDAFDGSRIRIDTFHLFDKNKGMCLHISDWDKLVRGTPNSHEISNDYFRGNIPKRDDIKTLDYLFAGKEWVMVSIRPETLSSSGLSFQPLIAAIIVLIFGALLAVIFHNQYRRREEIREKVRLRTEDLSRARDELELVLFAERKRTIQQYKVAQFGQKFLSGIEKKELFNEAVSLVSEVLDTDFSAILEHHPEENSFSVIAGAGLEEGWVGSEVPGGMESQSGYTLIQDRPVLVENIIMDGRFGITDILKDHNIISSLSVQIHGSEAPFGILIACSDTEKKFSEDDAHFLESVSNTIAAALLRINIEEELRDSEKMLSDIIENQGEGIAITDREERFVFCNPSADEIFGVERGTLVGRSLMDFLPENEVEKIENETAQRSKGERSSYELRIRQESGDEVILLTTVSPRFDNEGNFIGSFGVFRDITARKMIEKELRISERRFRDIVNSMADWIWETDAEGSYVYCSENVKQILGYEPREMLGKKFYEFFAAEEVEEVKEKVEPIFRNKERIKDIENWNIKSNGEKVCLLTNGVPILDEQGNLLGYRGVDTDITERKEAETRLKETNRKLQQLNADLKEKTRVAESLMLKAEKANQAKSEFLANMSHEIRTPMNGVIGMISLLLETDLTSEQLKYAETVQVSAETLMKLINDILDFSKIEAGKLELEELDFDLNALMEDFSEMMALKAQEKGLEFVCFCKPSTPANLRGDPSRIKQVLINLVGNAVKFTDRGQVEVTAETEYESDNKVTIRFSVRDSGIGIPDEKRDLLFEKFSQVDASTTRKYGGTGLGLAISKQLVNTMEGLIGVKSEVGKGTKFWFSVPLEKGKGKKQDYRLPAKFKGERILVVDDNSASRKMIATFLDFWGLDHDDAENHQECIEKLTASMDNGKPFLAALIDNTLGDMDGIELGKIIRSDKDSSSVKLLLMESLARICNSASSESSEFSEVLVKPLRPSSLFKAILKIHSGTDSKRVTIPNNFKCRSGKQSLPDARILIVEDNLINQKVAQGILKKLNCDADVAANGKEALEVLKSSTYDLVFMDCQMPVMDGYEATRMIRDADSGVMDTTIPVIAMTANALKGDREKCLDAGMNDYITKPVTPDMILEILTVWLIDKEKDGQDLKERVIT